MLFKEGNIKSKVLPAVMMVGVVIVSFLAYVDKPEVAEAEWYSTGGTWTYRKTITIQHGQVSGTADHTSFPVLVDLTDADLAAEAQADGDDILFTSSDGSTKLDHEIELYTTATGRLTAWVRIPTLDYDNDTVIYMYYGNSGATNQQNPTGVWDSNYKGVWHMDEATGANRVDEISSFAMVEETGIDIDRISGKIGYAASAGTTNTNKRMEYLSSNLGINTNYTDSWWMKVNTEIGTGVYRTVDRRDITTLIGSITRYEYNSGTRRLVFITSN